MDCLAFPVLDVSTNSLAKHLSGATPGIVNLALNRRVGLGEILKFSDLCFFVLITWL